MKSQMVNLSIAERYALAKLQPTKGNFIAMTMTKNLIALLELKAAEAEEWGYTSVGPGRWVPGTKDDDGKLVPAEDKAEELKADIEFTERQFALIGEQLSEADEKGELEVIHARLYEVFVLEPKRALEDEVREPLHAVGSN